MINPAARGPRAKEIWDVNLDPVIGHEQGKERPAIVISGVIEAGIFTVVPITKEFQNFEHTYSISKTAANGLELDSRALIFQIRSVSEKRFVRKRGILDKQTFENIKQIIKKYLFLGNIT